MFRSTALRSLSCLFVILGIISNLSSCSSGVRAGRLHGMLVVMCFCLAARNSVYVSTSFFYPIPLLPRQPWEGSVIEEVMRQCRPFAVRVYVFERVVKGVGISVPGLWDQFNYAYARWINAHEAPEGGGV